MFFGTDEQVRIVFRSLCSTCVQTNITVIANFLPQQSSGLSGTLTICYTLRVKGWHQLKVVMAVAKITDWIWRKIIMSLLLEAGFNYAAINFSQKALII